MYLGWIQVQQIFRIRIVVLLRWCRMGGQTVRRELESDRVRKWVTLWAKDPACLTRRYIRTDIDSWQARWLGIEEVTSLAELRSPSIEEGREGEEMLGINQGEDTEGCWVSKKKKGKKMQNVQLWPAPQLLCEIPPGVSVWSVTTVQLRQHQGVKIQIRHRYEMVYSAHTENTWFFIRRGHTLKEQSEHIKDDWLCRVCSRGQVWYLHLLAETLLHSATSVPAYVLTSVFFIHLCPPFLFLFS